MTYTKIKQFKQQLLVECPGYPNVNVAGKRTQCNVKTTITLELGESYMQNRRKIASVLEKKEWHKLKTLGVFQSFCPKCSTYIKDKRKEMKELWG